MAPRESKNSRTKFLVLLALSHGNKHGYEISKFIEERTRGFFVLPFGSLYPVLHRLESDHLITAIWLNTSTNKPKKSYSLSKAGKAALKEEVESFKLSANAIYGLIPEGV